MEQKRRVKSKRVVKALSRRSIIGKARIRRAVRRVLSRRAA
jgi:hypothetical protein